MSGVIDGTTRTSQELPAGWTPDLIQLLKRAAVEAGFGPGKLALAELGGGHFTVTQAHNGSVTTIPRRIVVRIDGDSAAMYWRRAEGPLSAIQQALLSSLGSFPTHEPLSDGTTGYFVRVPRTDDCLAAAIATFLQVPIDEVPDPRIDQRLAAGECPEDIERGAQSELAWWLASRGLRVVAHRKLPTRLSRWIGVVESPGVFNDHCLVMCHNEILFDPTAVHFPGMPPVLVHRPEQVSMGLSFQPLPTKRRRA